LEKLLINCQHLSRLVINNNNEREIDFARLFEILCKSSPIGLSRFKIIYTKFKLEPLKSFFNNWKNRHPIELTIWSNTLSEQSIYDLIQKYEAKGVIKKCEIKNIRFDYFNDFEWMQKKSITYFNMDKLLHTD